jgi:hypothetical protein
MYYPRRVLALCRLERAAEPIEYSELSYDQDIMYNVVSQSRLK